MKLLRTHKGNLLFEISPREKDLLLHVLQLYPLVPATHHRLTKGGQIPDQAANQHLLEESLKTQRTENQRHLKAMLREPERFTPCKTGFHATFARAEIEWLLQVLNDVRIGSWIALGSPDEAGRKTKPRNKEAAIQTAIMELAGGFEMLFLEALAG
jgi:hypothetical protein